MKYLKLEYCNQCPFHIAAINFYSDDSYFSSCKHPETIEHKPFDKKINSQQTIFEFCPLPELES